MMNRILLACLLFAGSSWTCKWMDTGFKRHTENSLALLKSMKTNLSNFTDDMELPETAAFPNELYGHASKAPLSERLEFVAHVLDRIVDLFQVNKTRAFWSSTVVDNFRSAIKQQVDGVRSCAVTHEHHKIYRKINLYFKRLSRHVLEEGGHSAEAWVLICKQVRLHIHRTHLLAVSSSSTKAPSQ